MEKNKSLKIVIILAVSLVSCGRSRSEESDYKMNLDSKKQLKDFIFTETDKDTKKWTMHAESARVLEDKDAQELEIKRFEVEFFNKDSDNATLVAEHGFYNRATEALHTMGAVTIDTPGKTIITSDVTWDPKREKFITDKEVLIKTESGSLKGKGMEASKDLEVINLKEKISGEFTE